MNIGEDLPAILHPILLESLYPLHVLERRYVSHTIMGVEFVKSVEVHVVEALLDEPVDLGLDFFGHWMASFALVGQFHQLLPNLIRLHWWLRIERPGGKK
jgi:hypothetical protein